MNEEKRSNENNTMKRLSAKKTVILSVLALASSIPETLFAGSLFGIILSVLSAALLSSAVVFSGSFLPLLCGAISFAAAFVFSSFDPIVALSSLEFTLIALVLTYSFKKKHTRLSMICRISALLAVFELGILALIVLKTYGRLDGALINELASGIHTTLSNMIFEKLSPLASEGVAISYELISQMIAYVLTLTPAILITLYNVIAYFIQRTVIVIGRKLGMNDMIYPEACIFRISRVAAFLYIASYLATVFVSGGSISVFGAVTENLIIILTPGLALLGVKDFLRKRRERASAFPLFLTIAMIFLLFTVPALFFGLASFAGAWAAFRRH